MEQDEVMRDVAWLRTHYVARGRLEKARSILREQLVWAALGAIAEGCDDPAALAREVLAVYEEACKEE